MDGVGEGGGGGGGDGEQQAEQSARRAGRHRGQRGSGGGGIPAAILTRAWIDRGKRNARVRRSLSSPPPPADGKREQRGGCLIGSKVRPRV